jgi:hypothetical protein
MLKTGKSALWLSDAAANDVKLSHIAAFIGSVSATVSALTCLALICYNRGLMNEAPE